MRNRSAGLVLTTAALALLIGCGQESAPSEGRGRLQVAMTPVAITLGVSEVHLTVEGTAIWVPMSFDTSDGSYRAQVLVPEGTYTIRVDAFRYAAGGGLELVASGSASVAVLRDQTTTALVRVLDVLGPPPVPDHAPVLGAVVAESIAVMGRPIHLTGSAFDLDGDPLSFSWTQACSPGLTGTFADAASPTTTWTPDGPGTCTLRLEVTANGKSDAASIDITVSMGLAGEGQVVVTAVFVPREYVAFIQITSDSGDYACLVDRLGPAANCDAPLSGGRTYVIEFATRNEAPGTNFNLSVDSGTLSPIDFGPNWYRVRWEPWPVGSTGVYVVTAGLETADGLTDSFPIVIPVW